MSSVQNSYFYSILLFNDLAVSYLVVAVKSFTSRLGTLTTFCQKATTISLYAKQTYLNFQVEMKTMNKAKLAVALVTGLGLSAASMSSMAMEPQVERALIKVCKSAASNKPIRLKNAMDDYNLAIRDVALKVMCNGDDIITFAETRGADKTASRLQHSVGGVSIIDVAAVSKINVTFEE